ncbi:MAG: chromate efflux transporter [Clostridiales bacterium]|nr:chromate efflux transporter [Clostridiales bacterium]
MNNTPYKLLPAMDKKKRLVEIALVFLKLGLVAFGGPAAHIAMMEEEFIVKRKWLTREEFVDFVGATNLLPGPNSTELVIHLGFSRGGFWGLILSGLCFILPAMLSVLVFAILYARHGQVKEIEGILYGIKPVTVAVILMALIRLFKSVIKGPLPAVVAAVSVGLYLLGLPEIPLLLLAGLAVMLIKNRDKIKNRLFSLPLGAPLLLAQALPTAAETAGKLGPGGVFFTFLKIGSFLYGSGYVLLAFLESEFVSRLGLLSNQQLLDAIAVGQFTPGPVFTTATFVGYLLGGVPSALTATAGIFLPSFVLVFALNPLIPKMRKSPWLGAVLDGVNAASLALMAAVSVKLGLASVMDLPTVLIFIIAFVLMYRWKVNSFWLILLGGLAGFLIKLI